MSETSIADLEARLAAADADPLERVEALNALAWELRQRDAPRAHELAAQARELAREHGHALGQARAARTLAMTVRDPEDLRLVLELAHEARRLFDEAGDGPGRAGSRDFLASIHEYLGDASGALQLALDALSIAREIGDPIRQGYALSNVGGILAASGDVDAAVERLEQALQLFDEARDPAGTRTIWFRLARVLKDAGRGEEALIHARRCRDAAQRDDDELSLCEALTVMAELARERGDAAGAEQLYRAALDALRTEIGRQVIGAETQVALGRLLMERGALDEARAELSEALDRVADEPLTIVTEAAAREALAELCERQEELPAAIEQLRAAQALRERIARRDARSKLAQVEARAAMEAAQKDAEIHRLRYVELHAMQTKLVEAEKMALLGRLAAGTAHELNTPLGVLRSNAELSVSAVRRLGELVGETGELAEGVGRLAAVLDSCSETGQRAVERIAAVADSFRRFSELDQAEQRSFDVREGLDSALALLEPTLDPGITVERRLGRVPQIEGWPRELNHAFMTVLQNAAQALDGAGVITVETRATEGAVELRISDTGRGMSEQQVARLFDVSWSEGGARTRVRLGLSAAHATVTRHGGAIEVDSAPGRGTTVRFRLPTARPDPAGRTG